VGCPTIAAGPCHHHAVTTRPFRLQAITIGDEPSAWSAAGFTLDDNRVTIATTVIELAGPDPSRGIVSATIDGLAADVDGLALGGASAARPRPVVHPNGVTRLDHLVAMSPAIDRTTSALIAAGVDHRRTRTFTVSGTTRRQEFFWLGDVILELVGDDRNEGAGPAVLWGLALTCADLDAAAHTLGEGLGPVKPAVQPGRRIATIRTQALGISVPVALMSPHPGDAS
jgi:hypothetical protein